MIIKMLNINREDRINVARMDREFVGNSMHDKIIRLSDIYFIIGGVKI